MKIGLQTWGSDGDIRPFCALAGGLSGAGHEVTLAVTSVDGKDYSDLAAAMGFEVIHVYDKFSLTDDEQHSIFTAISRQKNPLTQVSLLFKHFFDPAIPDMMAASDRLFSENDVIVGHFFVHTVSAAAMKHGKPYGLVTLCPVTVPSRYMSPAGLPGLGPWLNALLWKIAGKVSYYYFGRKINETRARYGVEPIRDVMTELWTSRTLTLVASSPALFNRPPDWGDHLEPCGFLNMPERAEKWKMPDNLENFLEAGDKPVYMTFGSLTPVDVESYVKLTTEATELAGCRAIIQADWDSVSNIPDNPNICRIGKNPHRQVFFRCAAVVHHGGAGTTQSSTLAGLPSIVVEHAFDQIYWAQALQKLGIAGAPLHRKSVTPRKLGAAIRHVLNTPSINAKARAVGDAMRKENGVGRAVELIEEKLHG